jgi:hypothetical protein
MNSRRENLPDDGRPRGDEESWSIGTTAMTQEEATRAAEWVSDTFPSVHAFVVDPHHSLTVGMDRETVEMMHVAVTQYASTGAEVGSMLELFKNWLSATE